METPYQNSLNNENDIHEDNLLLKIWIKPTSTLQFILESCPEKYVAIFFVLGGVSRAIDRAITNEMGHNMSTLNVWILAITIGGLTGWIIYYLYAWLMSVTGKWIAGQAKPSEFRTVLAWALVPTLFSLLLYIPQGFLLKDSIFKGGITDNHNAVIHDIDAAIMLIQLVLMIWGLVIYTKGTALIQGFSIGKAIGNILLCGLMFILPIIGLAIIFGTF